MKIISNPIRRDTVIKKHNHFFKTMIKAVVDIRKELIGIDAELHADLEARLLSRGSKQEHVWGINLFLKKAKKEWIEYTALINIRPSMANRSMEVESPKIRRKIEKIVNTLIIE